MGGGQVAKIWLVHSKDQVLVQGRWVHSKARTHVTVSLQEGEEVAEQGLGLRGAVDSGRSFGRL